MGQKSCSKNREKSERQTKGWERRRRKNFEEFANRIVERATVLAIDISQQRRFDVKQFVTQKSNCYPLSLSLSLSLITNEIAWKRSP